MLLPHYEPTSQQVVDAFMTRLKWNTSTGEFQGMVKFSIDCYLFSFDQPLEQSVQYSFIEYAQSLDLTMELGIIKIAIWLHQHHIPFTLTFQWNHNVPFWFNIQRRKRPAIISDTLKKHMDFVLAYDLIKKEAD